MAVPTVLGFSQVNAGALDSSASVTVAADCELVVALWAHFEDGAGTHLSALSLGGVNYIERSELAEGAVTDETGVGVGTILNSGTGSQTLAWTWSGGGTRDEGGEIVLVYIDNINAADYFRAAATNATVDTSALSTSVTSTTTDLVVAFCCSFTPTGAPVIDTSGTNEVLQINSASQTSHLYDVMTATGATTSTSITMTGQYYSAMAGISIKENTGAASNAPRSIYYRMMGMR